MKTPQERAPARSVVRNWATESSNEKMETNQYIHEERKRRKDSEEDTEKNNLKAVKINPLISIYCQSWARKGRSYSFP